MMLHAGNGRQIGVQRGGDISEFGFEPLLGDVRADGCTQHDVIQRLGYAGGGGAGRTGVFAGCAQAVTRLGRAAKIENARPVRRGKRRGPDLDGNIRL